MKFNINIEKLATEDPFKLLEGNETVHSANDKYMAVIEKIINSYLSSNAYRQVGLETCSKGLTTLHQKENEIVGFERHFNADDTGRMNVVSKSKDALDAISKYLSEKAGEKIEKYAKFGKEIDYNLVGKIKEIDHKLIEDVRKATDKIYSEMGKYAASYYNLRRDVNLIIKDYLNDDETTTQDVKGLLEKIEKTSLKELEELATLELEMNMKFHLTKHYSDRLAEAYEELKKTPKPPL